LLAQVGARYGHEKCRRHTLAGNIRHDDADASVGQFNEIVEIPAHRGRWRHARGAIAAASGGKGRRQDRALQGAGHVKFLLELRLRTF
jgi:hypothetical protein